MADAPRGFSAELGLHRLLELRGQSCTRQELREQAGGPIDLDALVRLLEQHGLEARPVREHGAAERPRAVA